MNIPELENRAEAIEAVGDRVMMLSTGNVISLCKLLREMGECLEYEVDVLGFDAACASDALKKYKEMMK